MRTDGIRAFVLRDWASVRMAKDRYWTERISHLGAQEGFRIAAELRRQALAVDPHWPRPDDRAADLAHHVRVSELLRRANRTRRP